ncbi:MAG TPA: FAD-dependent oxidoreductase, partial [Methanomassiliicoccaceae archaeon]|nr:FAD-dependent oxidoreductase [Methanomassiliicoccaceae archaeon]
MSDNMGAVMVVGGGISGVQAALDLAESGFKVYVVEKKPSIGGVMSQLDKTFPTNDCSMCILSPKLVEMARHPLVDLMTLTEVVEVAGEAPNFKVKVRRNPRYVDWDKCVGCGICAEKCPVKVPNEYDSGLINRKAI